MTDLADFLRSLLHRRVSGDGFARFEAACAIPPDSAQGEIQLRFAAMPRYVGRDALLLSREEEADTQQFTGLNMAAWTFADAARCLFLLRLSRVRESSRFEQDVNALFRYADQHEQAALLKSLPWLPGNERFLHHAREACRSNTLVVFTAVACENPYPAARFDAAAMNQMVMKAFFLGVPVHRIAGLDQTANTDRARIALDWIDERAAANRPIPCDVWRVVATASEPRVLPTLERFARHDEAKHRAGAALALGMRHDPASKEILAKSASAEKDEWVARIMQQACKGSIDWSVLSQRSR